MTTQRLNLSIIPGGMKPILNVSQYDKGQTWIFTLFEGSTTYSIPAGSVVTIAGTKKDNTGFQYPCTYSGANVTAIEEQQMTIFPGDVQAELRISNGDELVATINFVIRVEAAALKNDVLISDTELPLIEEAAEVGEHIDEWKAEIEGYAEDSEAYALGTRGGTPVTPDDPAYHNNALYYNANTEEIVASAWSDSTAYAVGDYVIDDHKLYRCIQANTAQQPPAASYWLEVKVGDELERIEAAAGVSSFNGRTGAVTPTAHDYDAADIDYDGTAAGRTADDVQEAIDEAFDEIDDITADTQFLNTSHHYDYAVVQEITAIGVDAGDVKVKIEPVQSGSGDPSPSNPRPISGWSEVKVSVAGKNLFDKNAPQTTTNGTATISGEVLTVTGRYYALFNINLPSGIYTASFVVVSQEDRSGWAFLYADGSASSRKNTNESIDTGGKKVVGIALYCGQGTIKTTVYENVQIEKNNAPTAFEPYKGNTYIIDLGGTRYGGVLDVTTGELTIDRAIGTLDGSQSFTITGDGKCFYTDAFNGLGKHIAGNTGQMTAIMSAFVNETNADKVRNNLTANAFNIGSNYFSSGCRLAFSNTSGWDGTQITNYFTNNPATIVYELATPITVQLSPTQVKLLKGYNNISANSGDISVDVYSLVESVSRVEDETTVKVNISALGTNESGNATASRAYLQDEYFYKDGKMYKCLTAIASGATFTIGTNCSETTLFAELTAALA